MTFCSCPAPLCCGTARWYGDHFAVAQRPCAVAQRGGTAATLLWPIAPVLWHSTVVRLLLCCGPTPPVLWHSAVVRRPLRCCPAPLCCGTARWYGGHCAVAQSPCAVAQRSGTAATLLWPIAHCAVAQHGGTAATLLWPSAPVLWHSAVARRPLCCGPAPLCCGTARWCGGHFAVSSAPVLRHSAVARRRLCCCPAPLRCGTARWHGGHLAVAQRTCAVA